MAHQEELQEKAQSRKALIMDVWAGKLTVTEAAQKLGVSRQTYYEMEHRALDGMLTALVDRPSGRPSAPAPDPQQDALREKVTELEKELLLARQTVEVKNLLNAYEKKRQRQHTGPAGKKNISNVKPS